MGFSCDFSLEDEASKIENVIRVIEEAGEAAGVEFGDDDDLEEKQDDD
jgi:hypothetical protein